MIIDGKKYCSGHREMLDVSEFGTNKSKDDGLNNLCKLCNRDYMRNYYHTSKKNNPKYKHYNDIYNKKCIEKRRLKRFERYELYVDMMITWCERMGFGFVRFLDFAITREDGKREHSNVLRNAILAVNNPRLSLDKRGRYSGFKLVPQ